MLDDKDKGMDHRESPYTVPATVERLKAVVLAKGIAILAHIDHSGDAAKAGLTMQPTELLIFGSAKSGTPLMVARPTVAIDLPLKALVWQDGNGTVRVSYNTVEYLQKRHDLPEELLKNIAGIRVIVEEAVR
jgi:uncharacterized protein (DUF302 family)